MSLDKHIVDQLFATVPAGWPTDSDSWSNQVAVDRSDQLTKLRHIYESGKRQACIEGKIGTGKTILVYMFIAQHSDLFPGGTSHLYADDVFDRRFDLLNVLPDVSAKPTLLAVDELERSQDDPSPRLRRMLNTFPQLRILAVTRSAQPLDVPENDVVSLTGLSQQEVQELLLRRLLVFDKENTEDLLQTLMSHQSLSDTSLNRPIIFITAYTGGLSHVKHTRRLLFTDRPHPADSRSHRRRA